MSSQTPFALSLSKGAATHPAPFALSLSKGVCDAPDATGFDKLSPNGNRADD